DGQDLNIADTYEATFASQSGCDSIVTLNLSVLDVLRDTLNEQICQGQTFSFDGQDLNVADTYEATFTSQSGCDSIVTLNLNVLDVLRDTLNEQICQGQTFNFDGQDLNVGDTYEATFASQLGCDSIVTLNLSVLDVLRDTLNEQICQGQTFSFDGQDLNIADTYEATFTSQSGCDSIVTLNLSVLDVLRDTLNEQICQGQSFTFDGQDLNVADTYEATFTSQSGCDSIVTLNLSVLDVLRDTLNEQICQGQTFNFDGQDLSVADTYEATFTSQSGCDSIVTLNLSVLDVLRDTLNEQICQGQSFNFDGQDLSVADTYEATFTSQSGCDSIVTLNLSVLDMLRDTLNEQICQGQSFNFDGQDLTIADTYEATFISQSGCDSIVTLNLDVLDVLEENITESICSGENFQFGNQTLSVAGEYRDTLQSSGGCDSIVILELTVEELMVSISSASNALGCDFEELELTADIDGDFLRIQWLRNGMVIDSIEQINVSEGGDYQLIVEGMNGCIAEDLINISEQLGGIRTANLNIQQPNCEGNEMGTISVDSITGGMPPYTYALNENPFSTNPNFSNLGAGDYILKIQDAQGCEWDSTITILPATDLTVNLGDDIVLPFGESTILEAIINKNTLSSIVWSSSGKDSLGCEDCLEQTVSPLTNTIYQIQVEDEEGCVAMDQIMVFVEKAEDFFVPNVFSPNGDSRNDFFYLQTNNLAVMEIENFQIFDRWGHLVFQRNNFLPNDETLGWDGRSQNGTLMNSAVFIFIAKVNYSDGSTRMLEGEVTLLR
ncbi:MAG: gliding motility-associated C-terminal domain-containing protein, partial [Bacteroidota bacterium]